MPKISIENVELKLENAKTKKEVMDYLINIVKPYDEVLENQSISIFGVQILLTTNFDSLSK